MKHKIFLHMRVRSKICSLFKMRTMHCCKDHFKKYARWFWNGLKRIYKGGDSTTRPFLKSIHE